MAFPPGFMDDLKSRLSITEIVGRRVTWDTRKSQPNRGDMWACCPFHHEKSPSFHVVESEGYYKCFGCQKSGDSIGFVMETENLGFPEAVEVLAREVGLQMPERAPREREAEDHRTRLYAATEAATRFFRLQLASAAGAGARRYLSERGLSQATIDRFELGFAPASYEATREALTGQGISLDDLRATGLVKDSDRGREPYDTFRDRVMFPIRDPRGRVTGFGARVMNPEHQPKYLNSAQTALFDKSRTIYNLGQARRAARDKPLILAEGYMDVIALVEAGFETAVAPMGTAITPEQLQAIWKISSEPVLMLDGDSAGLSAAMRSVETALPLIGPDRTLRFATLPAGLDPDDLIRRDGPAALRTVLDKARPLVDLLWQREIEGHVFDSPERRAALEARIRKALGKIEDPVTKKYFGQDLGARQRALFAPPRRESAQRRFGPGAPPARSSIVPGLPPKPQALAEAAILALMLAHPTLILDEVDRLEDLASADPGRADLVAALLALAASGRVPGDGASLRAQLADDGHAAALETLDRERHIRVMPCLSDPDAVDTARALIVENHRRILAEQGWAEELAEGAALFADPATDDRGEDIIAERLAAAAEARRGVGRIDDTAPEFETAANGLSLDRRDLARLRDLPTAFPGRERGGGGG